MNHFLNCTTIKEEAAQPTKDKKDLDIYFSELFSYSKLVIRQNTKYQEYTIKFNTFTQNSQIRNLLKNNREIILDDIFTPLKTDIIKPINPTNGLFKQIEYSRDISVIDKDLTSTQIQPQPNYNPFEKLIYEYIGQFKNKDQNLKLNKFDILNHIVNIDTGIFIYGQGGASAVSGIPGPDTAKVPVVAATGAKAESKVPSSVAATGAKAESKSDAKAESKSDAKAESKADAKAESKSDAKASAVGNDAKVPVVDAAIDAKAESKTESKTDSKTNATTVVVPQLPDEIKGGMFSFKDPKLELKYEETTIEEKATPGIQSITQDSYTIPKSKPKTDYNIYITNRDLERIKHFTSQYPDLETGGDFFGGIIKDDTPLYKRGDCYIHAVIGPGVGCRRGDTFWNQSEDYMTKSAKILQSSGAVHIGDWHSHNKLTLTVPSGGDTNTIQNAMVRYERDFFPCFITNIKPPINLKVEFPEGPLGIDIDIHLTDGSIKVTNSKGTALEKGVQVRDKIIKIGTVVLAERLKGMQHDIAIKTVKDIMSAEPRPLIIEFVRVPIQINPYMYVKNSNGTITLHNANIQHLDDTKINDFTDLLTEFKEPEP
jgi:hypothetical protein